MLEADAAHTFLDLPDELLAAVCAAAGGVATAHAGATCAKLRQLLSAQELWDGICLDAGLGGELLAEQTAERERSGTPIDWRRLYQAGHRCDHTRRRLGGKLVWEGDDPTTKLFLQPAHRRIHATCSCARCGRSYDAVLEAMSGGADETEHGRTLVTQVRFSCRATVRAWRECWYDDMYYG